MWALQELICKKKARSASEIATNLKVKVVAATGRALPSLKCLLQNSPPQKLNVLLRSFLHCIFRIEPNSV